MPYKSWKCSICGEDAPIHLRRHGGFKERMEWTRHHYKIYHPEKWRQWQKKTTKTKSRR